MSRLIEVIVQHNRAVEGGGTLETLTNTLANLCQEDWEAYLEIIANHNGQPKNTAKRKNFTEKIRG